MYHTGSIGKLPGLPMGLGRGGGGQRESCTYVAARRPEVPLGLLRKLLSASGGESWSPQNTQSRGLFLKPPTGVFSMGRQPQSPHPCYGTLCCGWGSLPGCP